jgi:hypothetical protein
MIKPTRIFLIASVLNLIFVSNYCNAGIFGPSDLKECAQELNKNLRYQPAQSMLIDACMIAFSEKLHKDLNLYKKASHCLVSKNSKIFSAESARSILNQCTSESNEIYYFFSTRLENSINVYSSKEKPKNHNLPLNCIRIDEILNCH